MDTMVHPGRMDFMLWDSGLATVSSPWLWDETSKQELQTEMGHDEIHRSNAHLLKRSHI
jgi:hypothetical protein